MQLKLLFILSLLFTANIAVAGTVFSKQPHLKYDDEDEQAGAMLLFDPDRAADELEAAAGGGMHDGPFDQGHGGGGASEPLRFDIIGNLPAEKWPLVLSYLPWESIRNLYAVSKIARIMIQQQLYNFCGSTALIPIARLSLMQHIENRIPAFYAQVSSQIDVRRLRNILAIQSNLQYLRIHPATVHFTPELGSRDVLALARDIRTLRKLESFSLSAGDPKYFNIEALSALKLSLASLPLLNKVSFSISDSLFVDPVMLQTFIKALSELKNITTLDIASSHSQVANLSPIVQVISQLNALRNVSLYFPSLNSSITQLYAFTAALGSLTQLTNLNLDLSHTNFNLGVMRRVSMALGRLTNLRKLTLSLNIGTVRPEGAKSLAIALGKLTQLTHVNINLSSNGIKREGALALANSLVTLPVLQHVVLDIAYNNLSATNPADVSDIKAIFDEVEIKYEMRH